MTKKIIAVLALSPLMLNVVAQTKKPVSKAIAPAPVLMKTQLDSASYSLGLNIAKDLKARGVQSLNYTLLNKAMKDVFTQNKTVISQEQSQGVLSNYFSSLNQKKFEAPIAEAKRFLNENKAKPGIVTLPSGLQYLVLKPAEGAKPKASDEVTVHYKGTLTSGKQFDSSYDRGEPATFPLTQVIAGWTEGVQQMNVGSKFRFFIPWQLGYGPQGSGEIPPYSVLIFDIELLKIGN